MIQRSAKFLYPTDWMTITLTIVIMTDLIFDIAPWEDLWYLPFAAGFLVGYLLVGRQKYILVANINVSSKHLTLRPWILYERDGVLCRQKQNNRDLIRRQFFGAHNKVRDMDGNAPQIHPDWVSNAKYPLFPKFVADMLVLEDVEESSKTVKVWWKFRTKVTTTHIHVAFASSASKLDLLHSVDVLADQQTTISNLYSEIHALRAAQGPKLMELAIRVNDRASSASPENRMYNLLTREDGTRKNTPTQRKQEVNDDDKKPVESTVET